MGNCFRFENMLLLSDYATFMEMEGGRGGNLPPFSYTTVTVPKLTHRNKLCLIYWNEYRESHSTTVPAMTSISASLTPTVILTPTDILTPTIILTPTSSHPQPHTHTFTPRSSHPQPHTHIITPTDSLTLAASHSLPHTHKHHNLSSHKALRTKPNAQSLTPTI